MRRLTFVRLDDQGAKAVIVALLMFFVALGLGAMTIDVGNNKADRRHVRTAPTAVALAVAKQCAADTQGSNGSKACGVKIVKLVG
jgi:Flp pilus assembly protein TadG